MDRPLALSSFWHKFVNDSNIMALTCKIVYYNDDGSALLEGLEGRINVNFVPLCCLFFFLSFLYWFSFPRIAKRVLFV